MSLDLRQNLKLSQQLLMTPQLQQAIKLLQLSRMELEQFVSEQLAENPLLEEFQDQEMESTQPIEHEPSGQDLLGAELQSDAGSLDKIDAEKHEPDWESLSSRYEGQVPSKGRSEEAGDRSFEDYTSYGESLTDHLMAQVLELDFSKEEQYVAGLLIGNLNEKGYLEVEPTSLAEDHNLDLDIVEGVLDCIQRMQPVGVGARNLQECLDLQLREYRLKNGVVEVIVRDHMPRLENRNFQAIAKGMGISFDEVVKNVATIAELDPIPARAFGGDPSFHIIPDVYIFERSGQWHVRLNDDGLPSLTVSSTYRKLVDGDKGQTRSYIHEKLRSAQWLIKSIQQRQKTIYRVTETILYKQMDFFEKGIQYLKPMILNDIAEKIEMHESTISRVTSHKYVHTPRGVFELKYFFSTGLQGEGGSEVASKSVQDIMKKMVQAEDPKKPLSDQKIALKLSEQGMQIARRTVAKYREQLGILPSSKRKKYY